MARRVFTPELAAMQTDFSLLSSFDVDHIATEALLFQAGYLTIAKAEEIQGNWFYTLGYPNREVAQALNQGLLDALTHARRAGVDHRRHLPGLLQENDFAGMQGLFTAVYAGIPHSWHDNRSAAAPRLSDYEGYCASVFYSYFAALGLRIVCEDISNKGRIDITAEFNRQYDLFEFKVVEESPEGRALEQIKAKGYARKYAARGWPIHLTGVEFSKADRSVAAIEVERFGDGG